MAVRIIVIFMSVVHRYFKNMFSLNLPSEVIQQEAYREITNSLNKAFEMPSLKQYMRTLSTKMLLKKGLEMFVGSRNCPKNIELSKYLMDTAQSKAKSQIEHRQIEYYRAFLMRMDAFKTGKPLEFDTTNEILSKLAQQSHPQSSYLVGKQLYNVGSDTFDQKQRQKFYELASFYLERSLTESQLGGLYYLSQIKRKSTKSTEFEKEAKEMIIYGAAYGDPLCYFKLSQIYLKEENIKLYTKYLKIASQNGVLEAQHNLGCEYMQGKRLKKDEVKALGWFLHASANGFIESKYNLVYLFINGSSCGRIKKNHQVALVKLEELKSAGQQVDSLIQQVLSQNYTQKSQVNEGEAQKQVKR